METSIAKRRLYMEMEQNVQTAAKRLWKIVRIVYCVLKTGMIKSKLMLDLNLMLKRGNKAITNLHNRNRYRQNASTATSPNAKLVKDYEFSCRKTAANNPFAFIYNRKRCSQSCYGKNDDSAVEAVKRVFELLEENDMKNVAVGAAGESPMMVFPAVRPLRVTDSPFPIENDGGDDHFVDKAAEEFIKKFYKNLKLQKKMVKAFESPFHGGWDR